ncbi:hypothetical protein FB451DRAFT_1365881 [Mycena latifolia]|nr:hypothetical protein FB451DRAFT_1365881 [Mycena latifolia]
MSMPPEILDYIFELLLPPAGILCPASDSDSEELNPFWQRSMLAKRTIVSVCRAWYTVGLSFLYRHIALANTSQIAALYRTLATHPELGKRVRCITFMSSLDVELFCEETAHEDMARIFELCPQLTRVNDLPPPPTERPWGYEHPHPCERLEELWLDTDHNPALDTLALAFPRLHTLHLTCGSARTKALARWDMPRLRRLTFLFAEDTWAARGTYKEYKRILALHGRNLEYLAFPDRYPLASRPPDLGPLLALCPTVRHLVAPVGYSLSRHVHPSVQRLDLWYGVLPDDEEPVPSEVLHDEFRAASAKKHFPSLVGTRTLQRALLPFFTDLARAVGPHARGDWRWALAPGLAVTQEDRGDICHVVWMDKEPVGAENHGDSADESDA